MKRSGIADLPLHGGHVPKWLAERMTRLGTGIAESVLYHYGASELLTRLSDPFWFQALGSVMGMDWHSSGITTSVMGALKRGLNPRAEELGIYICGGRGRHSRKTPDELRAIAERRGLDGDALVRTSRLTARVDNNGVITQSFRQRNQRDGNMHTTHYNQFWRRLQGFDKKFYILVKAYTCRFAFGKSTFCMLYCFVLIARFQITNRLSSLDHQ